MDKITLESILNSLHNIESKNHVSEHINSESQKSSRWDTRDLAKIEVEESAQSCPFFGNYFFS